MHFFTLILLSFLFAAVCACPPDDEQTAAISKPLQDKFTKGDIQYTEIKVYHVHGLLHNISSVQTFAARE
jgi:hypothetical protein